MVKVQIQLPMNISRYIEAVLREHIESGASEYPTEIMLKSANISVVKNSTDLKQAEVIIGFMPELEIREDESLLNEYISIPGRFPIMKELDDLGFADPRGCFHPFGIVPFIMFYNPDYTEASEIPRTWSELLDPKWKGQVLLPGKEHMAPRVIRAVLKHENKSKAQAVDDNFTCRSLPPNVIEAVKNGEFALGITNITFGRISESRKIKIIWPEDGLLCMPQVMAWKRSLDERMMKLGDFMLSPQVQKLLVQQVFIPVAPGTEFPEIMKSHRTRLKWAGWDHFRQALKNSEIEEKIRL